MAREPMIEKENRPAPIDLDAPIADWKIRDLVAVITAEVEQIKIEMKPEILKPERLKPEILKPEHWKPEKVKPEILKPEQWKPEKEFLKPEKEFLKPEKEFGPEKEWDIPELVDQIAVRVVEMLEERGLFK